MDATSVSDSSKFRKKKACQQQTDCNDTDNSSNNYHNNNNQNGGQWLTMDPLAPDSTISCRLLSGKLLNRS